MAYMQDTVERRMEALKACEIYPQVVEGRSYENVDTRVSLSLLVPRLPYVPFPFSHPRLLTVPMV